MSAIDSCRTAATFLRAAPTRLVIQTKTGSRPSAKITAAFIDLGDQFIQLTLGRTQVADTKRHFGFVVDDREAVKRALDRLGIKSINDRLNILDLWGNRIEIVPYDDIQFTKADHVLKGMGVGPLRKTPTALAELQKKGMAPER